MPEEYRRQVLVVGSVPSLGPVVLFDDMEGLKKWSAQGNTGDFAVTKDSTVAYNGSASMKLETRATNPADADWVNALRYCSAMPASRFSLEFLFKFDVQANTHYIKISCQWYDGALLHQPELRYDVQLYLWQYRDSMGNWYSISGGAQKLHSAGWHRIKYTIDKASKEHIKLICNDQVMSLSGLGYYAPADVTPERFSVIIQVMCEGANQAVLNLDDVLVLVE